MAFKMKGSPMKRNFGIGASSPAKQLLEPNYESEMYSEKIGPANEPGVTHKLRLDADKVPLGDEYDIEYKNKRDLYEESRDYEKNLPIDEKIIPGSWSHSGNVEETNKPVEETNKPLPKHSVDDQGNPTMLTYTREYDPRTKTWKKVPVYQRY